MRDWITNENRKSGQKTKEGQQILSVSSPWTASQVDRKTLTALRRAVGIVVEDLNTSF